MGKYSEFAKKTFPKEESKDDNFYLESSGIIDHNTAANQQTQEPQQPEQETTWGDYYARLGQGTGGLLSGLGWATGSETLQDVGQDTTEYWGRQLSDPMRESMSKRFINDDWSLGEAWSDPAALAGIGAESLPTMIPGIGAAGGAAKAAQVLGAGTRAATAAGAAAGSATEGATIGAMVGEETEKAVMEAPEDVLEGSPRYQELKGEVGPDKAREKLASETANPAALISGAGGAALGYIPSKFFAKAVNGRLSKRIAKEAGRGVAREAPAETAQEGLEGLSSAEAQERYANIPYETADIANQAIAGGVAGTAMGGTIGAGGALSGQDESVTKEPDTADKAQAAQDATYEQGGDALDAANASSSVIRNDAAEGNLSPDTPLGDIGALATQSRESGFSPDQPLGDVQQPDQANRSDSRAKFTGQNAPMFPEQELQEQPEEQTSQEQQAQRESLAQQYADSEADTDNAPVVFQQDGVTVRQRDGDQPFEATTDDGQFYVRGKNTFDARRKLNQQIQSNQKSDPVLQNRDRSRPDLIAQMQDIAENPDYDRVSVSREPNSGAPMVFSRPEQGEDAPVIWDADKGNTDTVTMDDGQGGTRKIPVQYAVVEAGDVSASNRADGSSNEQYGSGGLTALNNGRTAGLQSAFQKGNADQYVEDMAQDKAHGVSAEAIRAKENPMLVRLFDESALQGIDNIGDASNPRNSAELSASEQANTDARKLDIDTLAKANPGPVDSAGNRDFARSFIEDVGGAGKNNRLIDSDGLLTQDGRKRIQNALVARAYGDDTLTQEIAEASDSELKTLGDALAEVAPQWALMRERAKEGSINPEMDITEALQASVNMIRKSRQEGRSLSDLAGQVDAFAGEVDQMAKDLLSLFYRGKNYTSIRGRDTITKTLTGYIDGALQSAPEPDMFGNMTTPQQVLEAQRGETGQQAQQQSEQQPESAPGVQPDGRATEEAGTGREGSVSNTGRTENAEAGQGNEERQTEQDEVTSGLELEPQTEAELSEQQRRQQEAEQVEADARREEEQRVKADEQVDSFTLAGSDLPADQAEAQGQDSLLDQPAESGQADEGQQGEAVDTKAPAEDPGTTTAQTEPSATDAGNPRFEEDAGNTPSGGVSGDRPGSETTQPAPEGESPGSTKADSNITNNQTKSKIDDFGETIEGARKEVIAAYRERMEEAKDLDVADVPLSKSWPEPDYQKMIDEGADPEAVGFARAARDEVPHKPRKGWKLNGWVSKVEALRSFTERVMSGDIPMSQIQESMNQSRAVSENVLGRAELYAALGHDQSLKGVRLLQANFSRFRGEENVTKWIIEKPAKTTAFGNMPAYPGVGDTKQQAIDDFRQKLAEQQGTDTGKQTRFDVYSDRQTKDIFIGKKVGKDVIRMKEGFESVNDARSYLRENQQDLENQLARMKDIPAHRKESNAPRVGVDHRNGGNVTPEAFSETFGFRGVQFGSAVSQSRRQEDLNNAYDALMDMAGVLNVPARALSLNGELGLAFGARGKGGKRPAKAHYEPNQVVINLTKREGAGSLAHEWWHALDNYFASREADTYATEGMPSSDTRQAMKDAFKNVIQTITRTRMRQRSKALDKTRTKAYWSTEREMSARSFESYVIEKLKDQNASNDYLANIVSEDYWTAAKELGLEEGGTYPYPEAAEVPQVRSVFDEFFQTVETKETDQGTALFSRSGDPRYMFAGPQAETSDVRGLAEAKEMQREGRSMAGIRNKTGWFRGVDGQWRYEIDDSNASIKRLNPEGGKPIGDHFSGLIREYDSTLNLSDVLDHPKLLEAYPELASMGVSAFPEDAMGKANASLRGNNIALKATLLPDQALSSLLHEIQHAIQNREGFARGASPNERFAGSVKDAVREIDNINQRRLKDWINDNQDLIEAQQQASDLVTYGLMYRSAQRLMEYANRDKPSGVLKLVRQESEWAYYEKIQQDPELRRPFDELEREWYNLPRRHKGRERNLFIRDQAGRAAELIRQAIPEDVKQRFNQDERSLNGMVKALEREATRSRKKLEPKRDLEQEARQAERMTEQVRFRTPFGIYQMMAGEVEARNTQARQTMTEDERRTTSPEVTADTASDEAIVVVEGRNGGTVELPYAVSDAPASPQDSQQGLTATQARTIADDLMSGWTGRPMVTIADSISEFPKGLRNAIRQAGAEGDMRAVFWDDQIYILAPRIPNRAALEEVILHETVGHYGLRKMLGNELKPTLNKIYLSFANSDRARQIRETYFPDGGFDANNSNHRMIVAEELLAHMAETGQRPNLLQQAVARIREGLRRLGFTLDINESELLNLLRGARRTVENGGFSRPSDADTNFSRAGQYGSDRTPWPDNFPKVPFAAPLKSADQHPRYNEAKAGDIEAAKELVDDVVSDEAIERVKEMIGDRSPVVAPVFAEEATGRNMIPVAYAVKIARELELTVDQEIIQSIRARRTGTGSDYRLANHAVFEGSVAPGQDYLVVDDTMTMGGTLAGIRGHIEANGGTVIGATTLTGFGAQGQLALTEKMRQDLQKKHGASLDEYLKEEFGYGIDSLTQGEAGHFRKAGSVDAIRERVDAARFAHSGRQADEGLNQDLAKPEVEEITDESEIERIYAGYERRSAEPENGGKTLGGGEARPGWREQTQIRDVRAGGPETVFRGSNRDLTAADFEPSSRGMNTGHPSAMLGTFFTSKNSEAQRYGAVSSFQLDIRNPYVIDGADLPGFDSAAEAQQYRDSIEQQGHDGIVIDYTSLGGPKHVIPFNADQVIEPESEPRFSRAGNRLDHASEHFDDLNTAQKSALNKIAPRTPKEKATDWIRERMDRWQTKLRQGAIDRFAALKDVDETVYGRDVIENSTASSSWVLAQMSGAASGALQTMLTRSRVQLDTKEKVIKPVEGTEGLSETLKQLGSSAEIERFFGWIAGNRSDKLMAEGRENLFEPHEVEALKELNRGKTSEGKDRGMLYAKVFREFQQHRDDILDIAEKAGIITSEQRQTWADEFYVPFYRLADSEGQFTGPKASGGISRQEAYKKLKGGSQNLNDLVENTMMNFHHLMQASLKNQAALQAVENAQELEIASEVKESERDTENSTFVLRDGEKVWYQVDDPLVFKAVSSLSHPGMNSSAMKIMRGFKRLFTNLTTTTPQFVVANLMRDAMQASATSEVSKNFAGNIARGTKAYGNPETRARMMASGGSFSFGHLYGENSDELKMQLSGSLAQADILRKPSMVPSAIRGMWRKWNEITEFTENVNRAEIFNANRRERGDLYAAFKARDLMNFSQHGAWPAMRVLIDIVPFLNARLQGLDKIYRSGVKPGLMTALKKGSESDAVAAKRFWTVAGTLAMASMALRMANEDDEEFQKLEEWHKDTYWWFRISENHAISIPKPFEVGAMATMAERLTEQAISDTANGDLFRERMVHMLTDTFAFSPVPQIAQPTLDVYSNYDAFTGRPIESMGMERLSPALRRRNSTTRPAEMVSEGLQGALGPDNPLTLSPVQVDHLVEGYLGQVGGWVAGIGDTILRTAQGETAPADRWYENQPIRRFYENLGDEDRYTRYGSVFYDALRETRRVYSDIREYQELGRTEEALQLLEENRQKLAYRKALNRVQKKLSDINKAMDKVRRMDRSAEYKRREMDRLRAMKNQIQVTVGKRLEELNS